MPGNGCQTYIWDVSAHYVCFLPYHPHFWSSSLLLELTLTQVSDTGLALLSCRLFLRTFIKESFSAFVCKKVNTRGMFYLSPKRKTLHWNLGNGNNFLCVSSSLVTSRSLNLLCSWRLLLPLLYVRSGAHKSALTTFIWFEIPLFKVT